MLLGLLGYALYPRLARWYVSSRVIPKWEKRLGRDIAVEKIAITRGRIVMDGITVKGPADGEAPLLSVGRVTADFDFWASVRGRVDLGDVSVERPRAHLRIAPDGTDNWSDALAAVRKRQRAAAPEGARKPGGKPRRLDVRHGGVVVVDEQHGARLTVDDFIGGYERGGGPAELVLTAVAVTTKIGPSAGVDKITVTADGKDLRGSARVTVEGGHMTPTSALALTGIGGTVAPGEGKRVVIDLQGGYGGVEGTLWRAQGWFERDGTAGEMNVRADRFTFDKLSPSLDGSPIMTPEKTSLDVTLDLVLDPQALTVSGAVNLAGLTIFHPWLAAKPVKDMSIAGQIKGRYDREARLFELGGADVQFRGVQGHLEGYVALPGGRDDGGAAGAAAAGGTAPAVRAKPRMRARLVVPAVTCQKALAAIPPEIIPRLQGFRLKGKFVTDVSVDIDWANLEALELGGKVGIYGCKVDKAPKSVDTEKLLMEFEHVVEVEKDKYLKFVIGPSNPDFVLLADVSPNLITSLMTTEDGLFFKHRGFIVSEFKTALRKNLEAGYFKYGASSITMQFVKNIMLRREKTMSRKLQELFLTWYVEETLEKERILEIYLNAIEFGPGLYGIGRASYHYFGKPPSQLTLREAAFFSTLLPNPKKRHLQYCDNKLWRAYELKIERILKKMLEKELITELEYMSAQSQPLVFSYPADFDDKKCRKETERIIKNSRSTTPSLDEDPVLDDDDDLAGEE